MIKKFLFSMMALLLISRTSQAGCFLFFCSPSKNPDTLLLINPEETPAQSQEAIAVLEKLESEMKVKFQAVESDLAAEKAEEALTLAKQILDTVRVKTGIDPKVRRQESFLIPTEFPGGSVIMADLSSQQKQLVIDTISAFRGGLYMDLLNLSKRTSLLYTKAFQREVKKKGGLTSEDRQKIIRDLMTAALVPMPLMDKNGNKVIAFDDDIANEDQTYLFDRELKSYLMDDPDFKMSEDDVTQSLHQTKSNILKNLGLQTPKGDLSLAPQRQFEAGNLCMDQADQLYDSFDKCESENKCFDKYHVGLNFDQCILLAKRLNNSFDRASSTTFCFNNNRSQNK